MAIPIQSVVNRLLIQPAPILFLDTCAFLDIMRVPFRDEISFNIIAAAHEILSKAEASKPALCIVIIELIEEEWLENTDRVLTELENHIKKLDYNLIRFGKTLDKVGTLSQFSYTDLTTYDLAQKLYSLSQRLLKTSVVIKNDDNCKINAIDRALKYQAPAAYGKTELKDCLIIEHYLYLCQELRNNAFSEKCLFVSSNTQDYGHPQHLRSPLDVQFANVNLIFTKDLAMANAMIKSTNNLSW